MKKNCRLVNVVNVYHNISLAPNNVGHHLGQLFRWHGGATLLAIVDNEGGQFPIVVYCHHQMMLHHHHHVILVAQCTVVVVGHQQQFWVAVAIGDGGDGWHWAGTMDEVVVEEEGCG